MRYVTVEPGVKVAVYDPNPCGNQTVLLVHGWPIDHRMYEYQTRVLCDCGYRCVSIDLRGFGASDAPCCGYTYDRMADDIYAVIRAMSLPPLTLVGFSMGGAVVIRYMCRFQGYRVCRLVLAGAAAPSFIQRPGYPYGMTAEAVDELIGGLKKNRPQTVADFGENFFASEVTPAFDRWFLSMGLDASAQGTICSAVSLRDADLRSDLVHICVPTLILHGKKDQICPFPFAEEMARGIRNSRLVPFEHSGHGLFYDEMDKFNRELLCFLQE